METTTTAPPQPAIPEGYKRTEVGVIPEDWEIVEISDVTDLITDGAHLSPSTDKYGLPIATVENLKNGSIDLESCRKISVEDFEGLVKGNCKPEPGDVLVSKDGTIGISITIEKEEDVVLLSSIALVRPKRDKIVSKYLSKSFSSNWFFKYLNKVKSGSALKRIVLRDLRSYYFSLPPTLEEQRAITGALSDVDELIAELDALIHKKRQVKKGAMQQLLTGKKRLHGFEGEWEEKTLGDVAQVQRGASPRPISSPKWFSLNKDVGWVRISDISDSDGKNLLKTTDYLSKAGIKRSRFLAKGSLILSIAATVGLPVITGIDTCIHDGFVGLTNLEVDQEFLYYKFKELENDLVEMGQTGSQNNINSTIVRNVQALFPPIEEQKAIARILSDMDAEIRSLEAKRDKYKQIKQGMMQELLTGKTRLV